MTKAGGSHAHGDTAFSTLVHSNQSEPNRRPEKYDCDGKDENRDDDGFHLPRSAAAASVLEFGR